MPTPSNQTLYNKVKRDADEKYEKPSAYKSGWIVRNYKLRGGEYLDDDKPKNLKRWFKEEWKDVGDSDYPVYRPTKRVSKKTPLTPDEIRPTNLKDQIVLKQQLKGDHNLPKFQGKGMAKETDILKYSNPEKVFKKAKEYLGHSVKIEISDNPKKKYMVYNPKEDKWIHFGQMGYEDFTKHRDPIRRHNYLTRTYFMKGNWRTDKYSPNNLSRNILW